MWRVGLRHELLCVEWDVKPYTLTHSLCHQNVFVCVLILWAVTKCNTFPKRCIFLTCLRSAVQFINAKVTASISPEWSVLEALTTAGDWYGSGSYGQAVLTDVAVLAVYCRVLTDCAVYATMSLSVRSYYTSACGAAGYHAHKTLVQQDHTGTAAAACARITAWEHTVWVAKCTRTDEGVVGHMPRPRRPD